jgi:hypothetical protein
MTDADEQASWFREPQVLLRVTQFEALPDDVQAAVDNLVKAMGYSIASAEGSCGTFCGVNACDPHKGDCSRNLGPCIARFPGCGPFS